MGLRHWMRHLVAEAPPEVSACEFRCDRTQCRHGEWERCGYRLRGGVPFGAPLPGEVPATPRGADDPLA